MRLVVSKGEIVQIDVGDGLTLEVKIVRPGAAAPAQAVASPVESGTAVPAVKVAKVEKVAKRAKRGKRRLSAAGRAKIIEANRLRWSKEKEAKGAAPKPQEAAAAAQQGKKAPGARGRKKK